MVINKHGSFYIRNGWPTKILRAVSENNRIFSPNNELEAVDCIGMGRVMIKALRYWAKSMGLIIEDNQQGIVAVPTLLFEQIHEHDIYCQNLGSLWLLHRELAINEKEATAWYWAFNEFDKTTFNKEEFVNAFHSYLIKNGAVYNASAVGKEFDCFKNTYVSDNTFDIKKIIEEDTIPFFAPLGLITYKGNGEYEKCKLNAKDIPLDIFYYCVLSDNSKYLETSRQIALERLLDESNQVCKYFNIGYSTLIELLQLLENRGKIKLFNNFGNKHFDVQDTNSQLLLQEYFLGIGE